MSLTTETLTDDHSEVPSVEDVPAPTAPAVSRAEIAVVAALFLLLVVFSGRVYSWFFVPKLAVLACLVGPGLVALVLGCTRKDRASLAAAAFLAWASLATALSDKPVMSVTGGYLQGNGLILVASIVGMWALGRSLGTESRRLLGLAIVAAAVLNAAFGWLQVSVDIGPAWAQPYEDRAAGFLQNPVHLAMLCSGALWIVGDRLRTTRRPLAWLATAALVAGALELSGSRIALVIGIAAVLWCAYRCGPRRGALLVAVVLVGVVLAFAIPTRTAASGGSQRLAADTTAGLGPRLGTWSNAVEAIVDRPLEGYGPGRYFVATGPRTSLDVARYGGGDQLYGDAHNFIVEYATTTGLVGLSLFLLWMWFAVRRARGPLLGFVVVVAITMLLEPQYIGLTPVVGAALGAAAPQIDRSLTSPRGRRLFVLIAGMLGVIGAVLGFVLVTGDVAFKDAVRTGSLTQLTRADERFPPWPEVSGLRAQVEGLTASRSGSRADANRAVASSHAAIRRDPADPKWWWRLGQFEEQFGSARAADAAFRQALERNPWSTQALAGRYRIARDAGDLATARAMRNKLCELGPATCIPRSDLKLSAEDRAEARP